MSTLAALPDAVTGATLREVATQAPAPRSLRHFRIRVDDLARRALRELQRALPNESAASILRRLDLPPTPRSVALLREFGFAYEPTDLNSQVRWRIHDAYGKRTILDGAGTTTRTVSSYGNQIGFTGRYHDAETGLVYMRARMMSPTLGRFLERDPVRNNAFEPVAGESYINGFNLYADYFVPNSVDPFGLIDCWVVHHYNYKIDTRDDYPGVRHGFMVVFKSECKPACCPTIKIYQWIDDGAGGAMHRDDSVDPDAVKTGPKSPGDPPYSFRDAPARLGGKSFTVKDCAVCVKSGGTEETISCITFTVDTHPGGGINLPGGTDKNGNPAPPTGSPINSPGGPGLPASPGQPGPFTGCGAPPAPSPGNTP